MLFTVKQSNNGERLDKYLTVALGNSRSQIQRMIKENQVLVNGQVENKHYQVLADDKIEILSPPPTVVNEESKKDWPIKVIKETSDYLILYKPAGLLVHAINEKRNDYTLVDWLAEHYPDLRGVGPEPDRPDIVHRLDKDVSGLLVIARKQAMFDALQEQLRQRKMLKEYLALAYGVLPEREGEIDFPIARGTSGLMVSRPKKEIPATDERQALTYYQTEKQFLHHTLVRVFLLTGRTNQIRVHFKALGHSLVGDIIYANRGRYKTLPLGRVFLQAVKLGFWDLTNEYQEFNIDLDQELQDLLKTLK